MALKTNPNGVRYRIERTGEAYTVYVVDVISETELPGFMTRKCAERCAAGLMPIVDNKLIRSA